MFHPSVTDAGICHVYNGNSMNSTFAPSERTTAFQEALDPRTETVIPAMINGTGKIYEVTFWLNIADRYGIYRLLISLTLCCHEGPYGAKCQFSPQRRALPWWPSISGYPTST